MARYSGAALAISFVGMIVLVLVILITNQGDKHFGVLQIITALFALVGIGSSIVFGLQTSARDRKPHRGQ